MPPPEAGAPGILALADRGRLGGLFAAAGFSEPEVDEVPFTLNFADSDDYWEFLTRAAGAIALVLDRLSNDERERIRTDIAERVTAFESVRGVDMPAVSLVAAAS